MRWIALSALLVTSAGEVRAQCAALPDSAAVPDVRIIARVRAAELRFSTQPRADVVSIGCVPVDTVRVLVRSNIPETVRPGVTYRDVEIAIEIVTSVSVLCSPALRELIRDVRATPRLAALCALASGPGGGGADEN